MRLGSVLLLGACGGEPGGEGSAATEQTEFACELGTVDESGAFTAASEGEPAELVLGFQGFLFVVAHLRGDTDCPDAGDVLMSIEVDGAEPMGGSQPAVEMDGDEGGPRVSEEIKVFLTSNDVGWFTDRDALISMRLDTPEQACTASVGVRLVDDDPCIHTDDEPICPDDTGLGR